MHSNFCTKNTAKKRLDTSYFNLGRDYAGRTISHYMHCTYKQAYGDLTALN